MKVLIPVLLCLALMGGGCAGPDKDTVTEGDRERNHMTLMASTETLGHLVAIRAGGFASLALDQAIVAVEQIKLNSEQYEAIHGPPLVKKQFTVPNAEEARAKAAAEHKGGGFWAGALGVGITLASLAWAFVKTTALKHAAEAVETLVKAGQKTKEQAASGTLTPESVTETYREVVALAPPKAKAKIEETLVRVKERIAKVAASVPVEPAKTT